MNKKTEQEYIQLEKVFLECESKIENSEKHLNCIEIKNNKMLDGDIFNLVLMVLFVLALVYFLITLQMEERKYKKWLKKYCVVEKTKKQNNRTRKFR